MAFGRSLHVGIDKYSSAFPNTKELDGPENDAEKMRDLVAARGFEADLVQGPKATREVINDKLENAAKVSKPGDIFLFTFAGHGTGKALEIDPDKDEITDQAILLYDYWLYDDELRLKIWPQFKKDVRVLMIADSCYSGSVLALADSPQLLTISEETRDAHLRAHGGFYRKLIVPVYAPVEASILLLAACGDGDETPDGSPLSPFTAALVKVLEQQNPTDYFDLINKTRKLVGPQIPQLAFFPTLDKAFVGQKPFTI